ALARSEAGALLATVAAQQQVDRSQRVADIRSEAAKASSELDSAPKGRTRARRLSGRLQALDKEAAIAQAAPQNQLTVVTPPPLPASPSFPLPERDGILAFVAALVLGSVGAAVAGARADRFPRRRLEQEVGAISGLPVIGRIPTADAAAVVGAFRELRTELGSLSADMWPGGGGVRTVALISEQPGAGKSFVAVGLAASLAEPGAAVLLVDGDTRQPALHERIGLPRSPGLAEVLESKDLWECLAGIEGYRAFMVLTAGEPVEDPVGLLAGQLAGRVVGPFAADRGVGEGIVVIDTPARRSFPDVLALAARADATVVVLDPRSARRRDLRTTVDRLRQVNARPIGVVLNRLAARSPGRGRGLRRRPPGDAPPSPAPPPEGAGT
ncbi:MAG: hypothetical protein ACRD0J_00125, partial [Acidimicrobiales bacterium]